jgi:hypothetical protein
MTALKELIVTAWVDKIAKKMTAEASASVEFTGGTDFKMDELDWIRTTLIPALVPQGIAGCIRMYALPGDGTSCDCYGSPCEHASGRKFVAKLK